MTRPTPSLVLFDLDGVLVDYDRARRVAHLAHELAVDADAVGDALFASGLEDRFDAGALDAPAYLSELGAALGRPVDRALWAAARGAAMRMDPQLPALLARVASRCEIAVLTNNGRLLLDVLPALFPSLAAAFAGRMLCSGALGLRKPDPDVYRAALRELGHPLATTLFLDDVEANVEGARRAGLQAARVASPAVLPAVLASFGIG